MSQIFVFYIITTSGHVVLFINFLNIENLVKKLEYRYLVESTKIKNTVFPNKDSLSEVNVKTNRMGSTKWTYL